MEEADMPAPESAAAGQARQQLLPLAQRLRTEADRLEGVRTTLELPEEPVRSRIYEQNDALEDHPEVELDMHLEGLLVSARHLAWQAERIFLGLPPSLQQGEPDPGLDWPSPPELAVDRPPDA
jgi:hypothetical protein